VLIVNVEVLSAQFVVHVLPWLTFAYVKTAASNNRTPTGGREGFGPVTLFSLVIAQCHTYTLTCCKLCSAQQAGLAFVSFHEADLLQLISTPARLVTLCVP
jgi:hypothetical protein